MVVPARRSSSAQRKTQVGAYKKKLGMAAGKKALNIVLLGNNFLKRIIFLFLKSKKIVKDSSLKEQIHPPSI